MEVFKDYAYYYNAFYRDKDYASEAAQVDVLLKKYGERYLQHYQLWLWNRKT